MKLICAGFPKTGSKSCSSALRKLGYTVADIIDTAGKACHLIKEILKTKLDNFQKSF